MPAPGRLPSTTVRYREYCLRLETALAINPPGRLAREIRSFWRRHGCLRWQVADLGNNLSWPIENNCPGARDDPRLDTLADNGGPTQTIALLTGSPAVDAGNNETCARTDQRGVARPQGEAGDIGAFESALINVFITNTNDSGAGSLRQAILTANSTPNSSNGPDEIHFNIPSEGVNTIAPASELPAITDSSRHRRVHPAGRQSQHAGPPEQCQHPDRAERGWLCLCVCGQGLLISSGGSTIKAGDPRRLQQWDRSERVREHHRR